MQTAFREMHRFHIRVFTDDMVAQEATRAFIGIFFQTTCAGGFANRVPLRQGAQHFSHRFVIE